MDITTINPLALPSVPLSERGTLPDVPAIYFAIADTEVVYIGKARRLAERWKSTIHHRYEQFAAIPHIRIAWLTVSDEVLLGSIESACIGFFTPRLNGSKIITSEQRRDNYIRTELRLPDDLYTQIRGMADEEMRSFNNQIVYLLKIGLKTS